MVVVVSATDVVGTSADVAGVDVVIDVVVDVVVVLVVVVTTRQSYPDPDGE